MHEEYEAHGREIGDRELVRLNMRSLRKTTLGEAHLLQRSTWKDRDAEARAVLRNSSLQEVIDGKYMWKDAPFARMIRKNGESDKAYVDRLWGVKIAEKCVNKSGCRAAAAKLRETPVRKMNLEGLSGIVRAAMAGVKQHFESKYFGILDERTFVAMAIKEITPNEYDPYVRMQLFDMALEGGDLTKVPSMYDMSVSFGPWQMTSIGYRGLIEDGGLELGLPAKIEGCVSYEMQARAAVFYGYRRVLQIEKAVEESPELRELFELASKDAQREFLTLLMAKGHNGGSGRLASTLGKVKMAAHLRVANIGEKRRGLSPKDLMWACRGHIEENSPTKGDGEYAVHTFGIYKELGGGI